MAQRDVDWEGLSVLVVDDSKVASLMLKTELKKIGIKSIDTVEDGDHAITKCQGKYYNFVLIDFHLEEDVNGNELAHMLRSRHLIDRTCGIIIISGDNSSDVVLTVFSYNMDTFITKPIRAKELKEKMSSIKKNIDCLTPVYDLIDCGLIDEGISSLTEVCLQNNSYKLESELLNIFEIHERWNDLSEWLKIKKDAGFNQRREFSKALYYWQVDDRHLAVRVLKNLIVRMPRYIFAYDKLVDFHEKNGKMQDALDVAEQAARLTPTVNDRVLNLSRIAMEARQIEPFIISGTLLVKHMPVIDQRWVEPMSRYLGFTQSLLANECSKVSRAYVISKVKTIQDKIISKLPTSQIPLAKAIFYIYISRIVIEENQSNEAHVRMMLGLKPYFSKLHSLPDELLTMVVFLAMNTGERWLVDNTIEVLKMRSSLSSLSEDNLRYIAMHPRYINNYASYDERVENIYTLTENEPSKALFLIEEELKKYKESIELKLLKLTVLIYLGKDKPVHHKSLVPYRLPMPEAMQQWAHALSNSTSELKEKQASFNSQISSKLNTVEFLESFAPGFSQVSSV